MIDESNARLLGEKTTFNHCIITRFNLRFGGTWKRVRSSDRWIEKRILYLDKYLISSLKNQTDKNFIFYLCVDSNTDERYLSEINNLIKRSGINYEILSVKGIKNWSKNLCSRFAEGKCILSRLDSDDAVSPSYSKNIKAFFNHPSNSDPNDPVVFDYKRMYYYNRDTKQTLSCDYMGPTNFISLINYMGVSPYSYPHPDFRKHYKIYKSKEKDVCRVYHGMNVFTFVPWADWRKLKRGGKKGQMRRNWRDDSFFKEDYYN